MKDVELSLAMDLNLRTAALLSGEVRAEGIDLKCSSKLRGPSLFRHQLRTREFDICDMSLTTLYMMLDRADTSFIPIPVFTMRHFFHTTALVREHAGISFPEDLIGKRLGIPGYQSAASLWCRGAFQHEFGVSPSDVEWFTQRSADANSGEIEFYPPEDLRLNTISKDESLEQMLLSGRLDGYINVAILALIFHETL
ncbi:MAG TPA: hypothetical protein VMU99_07115 [Acidimicrobiales bacterium]|nr:hypothetical protein [Acidimicrobiales bacterium]